MDLPPTSTAVDAVFRDYRTLRELLPEAAASDRVSLDGHFQKLCVLSAASHLEALMTFHMLDVFRDTGDARAEFIRQMAIERKFFSWFEFKSATPASFFKKFGVDCHARYLQAVTHSSDFNESGKSFMRLCAARNALVHNDLARAESSLTPEEAELEFRQAAHFPDAATRIIRGV